MFFDNLLPFGLAFIDGVVATVIGVALTWSQFLRLLSYYCSVELYFDYADGRGQSVNKTFKGKDES